MYPFGLSNPALPTQTFDFRIKFVETPNGGSCPNDVFALLDGFPNLNFDFNDGTGWSEYFVNIFPSNGSVLSALTGQYAALAGVPEGTIGFTTVEGQSTTLPFAFTIAYSISSSSRIGNLPPPRRWTGWIGFLQKKKKISVKC